MCAISSNAGNWVGYALTAVGMIISVGVVLYQLGKQHKSSLKLQRSNAKEELKLRVYEAISEKALAFAEAELEAGSYARSITHELESHVHASSTGFEPSITELRADRLSQLHYIASSALTDLIVAIENWEIAFPAAELFRVALSSANHDVEETFHSLFQNALPLLPTDLGEKGLHVPPLPATKKLEELKEKSKTYSEARTTLRTYTHDLTVEAQNLLLSKLFKRRVNIRRPIDPSYKVVTASDTDALMHYFQTETTGGRAWEEAKSRVRKAMREQGKNPAA